MNNRFFTWFVIAGVAPVLFFVWISKTPDTVLVNPSQSSRASLGAANPLAPELSTSFKWPSRPEESSAERAAATGLVPDAFSVSPTSALPVAAGVVAAHESVAKQELFGTRGAADNVAAADRLADRESPEFAVIMAIKNSEMNAMNGRLAAELQSLPAGQRDQPLAPQNRKGPT